MSRMRELALGPVRRRVAVAVASVVVVATIPVSLAPSAGAVLTPFETTATLFCDGTLAWSVTVGAVPGQRFSVAVDLVPRFATAASTPGTRSGTLAVDPSVAHAVLFRRIVEAKVEEALSVSTGPCVPTPPPPPPPDGGPVTIGIGNASISEGDAGARPLAFTVALSGVATTNVSVGYETRANTADASDFVAKSGTVTIPAGASSAKLAIVVKGDSLIERNEHFKVRLGNAVGASIARRNGVGTILNDDPAGGLRVGIGAASGLEGNSGARALRFTVALSATAAQDVTVKYATVGGTASPGSDFAGSAGTVQIKAGRTAATILIDVNGDTTIEPDETFTIELSGAKNAILGRATVTGTILDDDTPAPL